MVEKQPEIKQELAGEIALVTGGGKGIGKAIAIELARAGARVVIMGTTEVDLVTTAAQIKEEIGEILTFKGDGTSQEFVEHLFIKIEAQLGKVTLLVNNAGRHRAIGPAWQLDPEEWWREVEVNLRSAFLCSHRALAGMVEMRKGRIVNLASGAGTQPRPYSTAYACSKAALINLTESLALSTKEYGISLFAIHPGAVKTALADFLLESPEGKTWLPEFKEIYRQNVVPEEQAAKMVRFLASGKADVLSGRFLDVMEDLNQMVLSAPEIIQRNRYTLRLNK